MTNQAVFILIFGEIVWYNIIVFNGLYEQHKEYWNSPYNEEFERLQESTLDKIREDINHLTVYYTTKVKGTSLISQKAVNRVIDKYRKRGII